MYISPIQEICAKLGELEKLLTVPVTKVEPPICAEHNVACAQHREWICPECRNNWDQDSFDDGWNRRLITGLPPQLARAVTEWFKSNQTEPEHVRYGLFPLGMVQGWMEREGTEAELRSGEQPTTQGDTPPDSPEDLEAHS